MAKEIERKFLVKDLSFKKLSAPTLYRQGYISTNPMATVRVRVAGDKGYIAVKSKRTGITRLEYEYEIPVEDANRMLENLCQKPLIEKYRYILNYEGYTWEIDEFLGDNEGLVVAEIELEDEEQEFIKPDFVGEEVTFDYRYRNSNLVKNPYKNWKDK